MNFEYNAFTADDIIDAVNQALADAGQRTRVSILLDMQGTLNNIAVLRSTRGATLVASLWSPNRKSVMGIRGIHRVQRPNCSWSLLINGQACQNLSTLVFSGENGPLTYCDYPQYETYLKRLTPNQEASYYQTRIVWEEDANPRIAEALSA